MKGNKAHKMALVISITAFVFMAGAMLAVLYVSEGDKDRPTAITMVVLPLVLGAIGYYLMRAWFARELVASAAAVSDNQDATLGKSGEMSMAGSAAGKTNGNSVGSLSQIISQVNGDVAQWAREKENEIAVLRNTEKFRREYIGNVSHELKTPLFNIQGYIETLIDGGLKDDEINMVYLERTDRNILRLISIVQDLDTISKFESGMLKLAQDNFDLVDLVEEVLDFNDKKANDKHIALKLNNTTNAPVMVYADKDKMYDVISNLVINSINYGNEGGTTEVVISDIENKFLLEVRDNGIGIAEKDLGRVFERFYRVDKSRSKQSGGTGLGLAIVKHIMEAHNEHVTVKSKIGVGTTFSITLKKAQIK